jgi:hypothetical protein
MWSITSFQCNVDLRKLCVVTPYASFGMPLDTPAVVADAVKVVDAYAA